MPYAAQVQRLSQVAAALADAVTPEQVAAAIVGRGVGDAGAYAGAIHLLSSDRFHLELLRAAGFEHVQLEPFRRIPITAPVPIARVAATGDPLFLASAADREAAFPNFERNLPLSYRSPATSATKPASVSWAALPLRARGIMFGTLALSFAEPHDFALDERTFLMAIAHQCALALDRALLLHEQEVSTAEQARTAAMLDTMLAQAPVGLCFVDRDLRYVRVNEALAAMNGRPAADHLGRRVQDVLGEVGGQVAGLVCTVFEQGRPVTGIDWSGPAPNGEMLHVIASFYPVRDPEGVVTWAGAVVVDVTELRTTLDALHARELQLHLAQAAAGAGCWEVDLASGRIWLAPELAGLLGIEAASEPLEPPVILERLHPADRERVKAAVAAAADSGTLDIEYRYEHPELGLRHFAVTGRVVANAGGEPRMHGLTMDVTARREADERLRRQEEHMRIAVSAASLGTWSWDVAGDRIILDDAMSRMLGAAAEDLGSFASFLSRVHEDDRDRTRQAVADALESQDTYHGEYRIVLPSGEVRWIADQARIFRGEDGRATSMAGVSLDVTARRRADEQLRQVQRIESIGRLAGGMAHEINNMMSVVLGFAEFVMRHPGLPAEARGDVLEIQKAAERAASVTRQVLAFSRRQVLMLETLDVNAVVREGHTMLDRLLGEEIELALDLASEPAFVRADRNQLLQALLNLSINARDAMPEGGRVTLATRPIVLGASDLRAHIGTDAAPGHYVSLTVTDTGTGMDAAVLGRAFEPFFTTKPVGRGTGLGLSTVYGIVKQSGGYVWVESEPGCGSTITVLLPLTAAESVARPESPAPISGIEGRGTVLLVEDEPLVRSMARRTLEELGYAVVEASGAAEALERAGALADDLRLVITDVVMPGMSGRDLGAHLAERYPSLPVLFVSGHPSQFVAERGLLSEGQAFLQKPFLPDVLGAAVRTLLDSAVAGRRPG